MELEKYIHTYSNTIPFEFCDQIIDEYENSDDWVPGTVNDYNVAQSRKCEAIYLSYNEVIQKKLDGNITISPFFGFSLYLPSKNANSPPS